MQEAHKISARVELKQVLANSRKGRGDSGCSIATSVHYRISLGQHMVPVLWQRKGKSTHCLFGVLDHATSSS